MVVRVFFIERPLQRIIGDIRSDAMQIGVVPDDVVVIIPLPDGGTLHSPDDVDSLRCLGFELTDDRAERTGHQRLRSGDPWGRPGLLVIILLSGDRTGRPYGFTHDKNPVHMIGHNHKVIQLDFRSDGRRLDPFFPYNLTDCVQPHLVVDDFTE